MMGDTLRDRIASIVTRMGSEPCCDDSIHAVQPCSWSLSVADALIRELGLYREGDESRTVTNDYGATYRIEGGYRYVTEWTNDE